MRFSCCLLGLILTLCAEGEAGDGYHTRSTRSSVVMREEDKDYWFNDAQKDLEEQLAIKPRVQMAKNVILFLGDGMSITTVTSARILKGAKTGKFEREKMSWEHFGYAGLSKTYNTNNQVTDSAASATAYFTGVKTNTGVIGLDSNSDRTNCSCQLDESIYTYSIAQWFLEAGRSAGFVTSTRVTHATPAGTYVHIAERDWEDDQEIIDDNEDPEICDDIAEQLVFRNPGNKFKVMMGGGRGRFIPNDELDVEDGIPGLRADGRNLIDAWLEDKKSQGLEAAYVWNKEDLLAVDKENTDHLLGLFGFSHLDTVMTRDTTMDPTLPEMTKAAIEMLSQDKNGYFLLVEGGRIDHMHHENRVQQSLAETLDFEEAVAVASSMVNFEDTTILVTADHGHSLTLNGYAARNEDIFGFAGESDVDHKKYTTLLYGNGPGFNLKGGERYEPTEEDLSDIFFRYESAMPRDYSSHDGTDTGVWVEGPFAHLFTGVHEENYIPHALAYASCVGHGHTFCDEN